MTQLRPSTFLAQPWEAAVTGWIVVFVGLLVELVGGVVTNAMSMAIAAPILIAPAAVAVGFAAAQWWQVRSSGSDPANWWHLVGVAAALFTWLVWPTTPAALLPIANAREACVMMYTTTPGCIVRATAAMNDSHITWWATGVLIVALALLARRSRIAAWAAIPVAFAGCQLAAHFLEVLLLHYHTPGA
jgi:hypothetical protein